MSEAVKLVPLTSQSSLAGARIRSLPILRRKVNQERGVWGWMAVRLKGLANHPLNFPKGF